MNISDSDKQWNDTQPTITNFGREWLNQISVGQGKFPESNIQLTDEVFLVVQHGTNHAHAILHLFFKHDQKEIIMAVVETYPFGSIWKIDRKTGKISKVHINKWTDCNGNFNLFLKTI